MQSKPAEATVLTEVSLRYSDMDIVGHLNNAVYATLFEAGRVAYIDNVLPGLTPEGAGYVIVRLEIDFVAEAHYPGTAIIGTSIEKVGGSSMTYQQEIHVNRRLVARAKSICAMFDLKKRKAIRCPEAMRIRLRNLGAAA